MPDVKIDRIDTLEIKEKWGVIIGCRRQALVLGLTGVDWTVLYNVLDAAGLPQWGSYLDIDRGRHLALIDRDVRMVDKDKAEVELTYGQFNDRGQRLFYDSGVVAARTVAGKMQTSVVQKRTNLYRPGGTGDEELITLEHTYPVDDPDYAEQTVTQTGEVDVYLPQRTFTVEGIKQTSAPWNIAERLVGAVNRGVWLGMPAHTWMCTEVTWEYMREGVFLMAFTFQHDSDTWNPTAVFIDDRTNRPPEGLVEDEGYKYLRYHPEVNFVQELGFYVIGPNQDG